MEEESARSLKFRVYYSINQVDRDPRAMGSPVGMRKQIIQYPSPSPLVNITISKSQGLPTRTLYSVVTV